MTKQSKFTEPLSSPEFGSYTVDQVQWLLKDLSSQELEAPTEEREELIQSGGAHYSESLPQEYLPGKEYQDLFLKSLGESSHRLALDLGVLTEQIAALKGEKVVLVSLARAGTPVGVLIKSYLKKYHGIDAPHYAISIVRGRGIDHNAITYIQEKHGGDNIIFIDGWTGKGAISRELETAVKEYNDQHGTSISPTLAVLADPGHCTPLYGTREDYLIPSACLNSTVSGLVSRTVLRDDLIEENDYHGAKFYKEFMDNDLSQTFIQSIESQYTPELHSEVLDKLTSHRIEEVDWSGWKAVESISEEYGINSVNLVKPGVGETTRVLLRRVPWRIIINPDHRENLQHLLLLSQERGVPLEERQDLPYSAVGLIHPQYTKGATGEDGKAVQA